MDPQDHQNRYYPGVAHIPYNNRNSSFLREMMLREDGAHEAWRQGKSYRHPRKPNIDLGLHGQSTVGLLDHDPDPPRSAAVQKQTDVLALKAYERELKERISDERAARRQLSETKAELRATLSSSGKL